MLQVTIPAREYFDERTNEFVQTREQHLTLEHSLVSLAKWESKWNKPFLGNSDKTEEECADYIRCMTLTQNVDPSVYTRIPKSVMDQVDKYIEAPMTATTFTNREKGRGGRRVITAEIIYHWMVSLNIPVVECQKWHLNRLMALIRVCNIENGPQKKMGKRDWMNRQRMLNAERKAKTKSRG